MRLTLSHIINWRIFKSQFRDIEKPKPGLAILLSWENSLASVDTKAARTRALNMKENAAQRGRTAQKDLEILRGFLFGCSFEYPSVYACRETTGGWRENHQRENMWNILYLYKVKQCNLSVLSQCSHVNSTNRPTCVWFTDVDRGAKPIPRRKDKLSINTAGSIRYWYKKKINK